ncbi:MAG: hypothetical protein JKP90_10370 [Desulfofustis sp. PB-SRB1]|jgi:hypothetical protein|nr:hypothetical protein [Desulfofustis sp. PB-SRB1]MBL0380050.1 hypothetical protein [Desulfofustis sp. PB-SRB1]
MNFLKNFIFLVEVILLGSGALLIKNHLALGGEIFTQRVLLTTVFMVVTICIVYLFAYLVDKYNEKSTEGKK